MSADRLHRVIEGEAGHATPPRSWGWRSERASIGRKSSGRSATLRISKELLERIHSIGLALHPPAHSKPRTLSLTRSHTHTLPQSTTMAPRECTVARVLSIRRRCAAAEASCHTPAGSNDGEQTDEWMGRDKGIIQASGEIGEVNRAASRRGVKRCGAGDSVTISAYLCKGGASDEALADFAELYADRNEIDYAELSAAVKAGRVKAETVPLRA